MSSADAACHAADDAWHAITRDRDSLHGFRVSHLYGCARQLHYRANRIEPSDVVEPSLKIDAHLGSAIHDFYLSWFAHAWQDRDARIGACAVEPQLELWRGGLALNGHPDVVAWYRDNTADVWDLKTHEKTKFDAIAGGDFAAVERSWWQVWIYARLIELSAPGKAVNRCLIHHLDRSDPQAFKDYQRSRRRFTDAADFTDEHRAIADTFIDDGFAAVWNKQNAPRWFGTQQSKATSLYSPCKACPWQSECLGKPVACEDADAELGDGVAAEVLRGWAKARKWKSETAAAVKEHIRRSRDAKAAGKAEGRLRELVDDLGLDLDTYDGGDGYRYRIFETGASEMDDTKAMKQMLTELGKEIPRKPKARGLEIEVLHVQETTSDEVRSPYVQFTKLDEQGNPVWGPVTVDGDVVVHIDTGGHEVSDVPAETTTDP